MKAAQLTGPRRIEINEIDAPVISHPDDVLVAVKAVGICGSDVHNYVEGGTGSRKVKYPFIPGHEAAGEVLEVGNAVNRIAPGDRVMIEPAFHCGVCDQCRKGRFNTCRKIQFLSSAGELQGCMCEKIVIPKQNCFKVSAETSYELAALAEPFSIALYSVNFLPDIDSDKPLAILGCGPIGLCTMLAARAKGARRIYMTDRIPSRLEVAARLGAAKVLNVEKVDVVAELQALEALGVEAVFECSGDALALEQAVAMLAPGGKLILTGIPVGSRITLNIDQLRRKEINIQNVRRQNRTVEQALAMLTSGQVDALPLITHRFALDDTARAFDLVADYADGVVKAMITI